MADAFDEISDDLRREKLNQFWKENGAWIIGGAVGAVLLTGALAFWRQWDHSRDMAATAEFSHLVTAADPEKLAEFSADAGKNHAMIARFAAAAAHLERKEEAQAVALYDAIAGTSGLDKAWRDLARLHSLGLRLKDAAPDVLKKELAGLAADGGAWRYTARELQALLAAREGKTQQAADILTKITADPQAPSDARTRAFTLRQLYVAEKPAPKS